MSQTNKSDNQTKVAKIILITIIILVIATLIGLIVFQQQRLTSTTQTGTADPAQIQSQVAKLMLLPNEEAVITPIGDDLEQVKAQPFFSLVESGDQVLIFPQAAKIVIYRPSQKIIVNVGPIIDDRESSSANPTPPAVETTRTTETTSGQIASDSSLINVN